jgi:hypothetical protein
MRRRDDSFPLYLSAEANWGSHSFWRRRAERVPAWRICHPEAFSDASFPGPEHPLLAHKATSDPDTLCLPEAMREPDWDDFLWTRSMQTKCRMVTAVRQCLRRRCPRDLVSCQLRGNSNASGTFTQVLSRSRRPGGVDFWQAHAPAAT